MCIVGVSFVAFEIFRAAPLYCSGSAWVVGGVSEDGGVVVSPFVLGPFRARVTLSLRPFRFFVGAQRPCVERVLLALCPLLIVSGLVVSP